MKQLPLKRKQKKSHSDGEHVDINSILAAYVDDAEEDDSSIGSPFLDEHETLEGTPIIMGVANRRWFNIPLKRRNRNNPNAAGGFAGSCSPPSSDLSHVDFNYLSEDNSSSYSSFSSSSALDDAHAKLASTSSSSRPDSPVHNFTGDTRQGTSSPPHPYPLSYRFDKLVLSITNILHTHTH